MKLSAQPRAKQRKIAAALGKFDLALPGSVEVRRTRCGKPACRCHTDDDARHGPYNVWTRKVNARTVTKVLTDAELREYRAWLDNSRRRRELANELHQLTVEVVDEHRSRSDREASPRPRRRVQ